MGFFAAAVFMLGVLPILLKAKEDQVYLYLNRDIHHLTIKNHKHRRICKLDHQLSRTCGHTMLINYHDDGIIDDDNRDNNDHRRIFR